MTWSGFQPSTNGFCHLRIVTKNFWQVWDFLFWGLYTEPINWPLLACSRSWCRVWSSVLGASHNWIFPCRGCENVCVRSGGVKKRVYVSSCPGFTCLLHGVGNLLLPSSGAAPTGAGHEPSPCLCSDQMRLEPGTGQGSQFCRALETDVVTDSL